MIWWEILTLIIVSLFVLMLFRVPIAFAFLLVNIVAAYFIWGESDGLGLLITSIEDSLTNFSLLPIPLFILMGEVMFQSGVAPRMINAVDKWIGGVPGRLSMLAVGSGALLSSLTASNMASTAMLGSTLLPDMEKQKYSKSMSIGPILGSGALAAMIPPSALGVLLASMGQVSVGQFLIAIIIPGILMASLYMIYIIIRAKLQPHLAPAYEQPSISFKEKLIETFKYILPNGFIFLFVLGFIFLGVTTPTEAAAMGAVSSMILSACYRKLTLNILVKSLSGTMKITVMIFLIISGSTAFSQILSFSGATRNLVSVVENISTIPLVVLILMLGLVIIMGTFLESLSIIMIIVPIFFPIAATFDFNLLWFSVLLLLAIEIGTISPPFGTGLFVMKGVVPPNTSMTTIYIAAIPYIILIFVLMALIIFIPSIVTWLPGIMNT